MLESVDATSLLRNLSIYTVGVAMAAAGALGLAEAIELSGPISGALFVAGLVAVFLVHEYFGGPL